jgi:hypothetical protein
MQFNLSGFCLKQGAGNFYHWLLESLPRLALLLDLASSRTSNYPGTQNEYLDQLIAEMFLAVTMYL